MLEVRDHHTLGLNASKLQAFSNSCVQPKTFQNCLVAGRGGVM